jgi:polyisoprenoid-binding protein YceI
VSSASFSTTLPLPKPGVYEIDPVHSEVGFVVRHLMVSRVRGRFHDVKGTLNIAEPPEASSAEIDIATASVDTGTTDRDNHLRSSDFFDVESYPALTFRSTGLRYVGGDNFSLDGELTIHGVTKTLSLDAEYLGTSGDPWGGTRIGFSASTEIDREQFGLTWNAAIETGGVVVGKTAKVEIEVEAIYKG